MIIRSTTNFSIACLRIMTIVVMLCSSVSLAVGQECKKNFEKAQTERDRGNYDKAVKYAEKARHCGNVEYQRRSSAMIADIKRMSNEKDRVKAQHSRTVSPDNDAAAYVIVPSIIFLPHGTEEKVMKIESSADWKAACDPAIVRVRKVDKKTLSISFVEENLSTAPRRAEVEIECGKVVRTITIEQDGAPEILEYKSQYMKVPYEGGRFIVGMNTNTRWTATNADWYKAMPLDDDSTRMVIVVDKNVRNEARNGSIFVRSLSGEAYAEMEIHQFANESRIFTPVDSIISIRAAGDTLYVPIISDNPSWTESDRPSWTMAQKVNADTLKIIIAPNEGISSRRGFVNIKSGDRVAGVCIEQAAAVSPWQMQARVLEGRNVSFCFTAGYAHPILGSSSSGSYTGSMLNYGLGTEEENLNISKTMGYTVGAFADLRIHRNWYVKSGVEYSFLRYSHSFTGDVQRYFNQVANTVYEGIFHNTFEERYSYHQLNVPLLASYRVVFDRRQCLHIDLGPVLQFGLSARMAFDGNSNSDDVYPHTLVFNQLGPVSGGRVSEYTRFSGSMSLYDTNVGATTTSSTGGMSRDYLNGYTVVAPPMHRVNAGLRVGVHHEFSGLQIGVCYTQMLTNMANSNFWQSERLPVFGQPAETLMAGYRQRMGVLEVKIGYVFR